MSILKVARMGHPVLRAKARPLDRSEIRSASIQRLIDDMMDTMAEYHGVGLAAPQVHESFRLFVAAIDELRRSEHTRIVGWEANGGFLTGCEMTFAAGRLMAPTL